MDTKIRALTSSGITSGLVFQALGRVSIVNQIPRRNIVYCLGRSIKSWETSIIVHRLVYSLSNMWGLMGYKNNVDTPQETEWTSEQYIQKYVHENENTLFPSLCSPLSSLGAGPTRYMSAEFNFLIPSEWPAHGVVSTCPSGSHCCTMLVHMLHQLLSFILIYKYNCSATLIFEPHLYQGLNM